nr:MAG TPA_asm: hypothetical protein [Caudoviricetes sp.]
MKKSSENVKKVIDKCNLNCYTIYKFTRTKLRKGENKNGIN